MNTSRDPINLLLVEDNFGDVLLARQVFKGMDVPVNLCVAKDGEEALSMLRKEGEYGNTPTPDLVLLDLNLPKMLGSEVLGIIKQDPQLKRIPVIILSSSPRQYDIERCYELHANAYLIKPQSMAKLEQMIQQLMVFWFDWVVITPNDQSVEKKIVTS